MKAENIKDPCYIAGIGASAGGLDALEKFFQNISALQNIIFEKTKIFF